MSYDDAEAFLAEAAGSGLIPTGSRLERMSPDDVDRQQAEIDSEIVRRGLDADLASLRERVKGIDVGLPMYESYRWGLDEGTVLTETEARVLLEASRLLLRGATPRS